MRIAAAGLVLLLLASGCARQAGDGGPAAQPAAATPTLEGAVARFPAEVAGFARGETVWHERTSPGMGVTTDYAGPARAAVATASLYDRGRAPVPADLNGAPLQTEFANAVREALAMADRRTSHRLVERERFDLPVPNADGLLCSRLEGSYGRQAVQTLVCLGEAAGRYLKVQVTMPVRQVRPVEPLPFVVGLTQALRG